MIVRVCALESIGKNHTDDTNEQTGWTQDIDKKIGDRDDPPSTICMPEIPQRPLNIRVTQTITVEEYNGLETVGEYDEYPLEEIVVWTGSGEDVR